MSAPRDRLRPRFLPESLEQRIAPAFDIAVVGATTTDSQSVVVNYKITGDTVPASVPLGIYRSLDSSFSSTSDQLLAGVQITGSDLSVGDHQITIPVSGGLTIDPSRKFVLAVADPANAVTETDNGNNVANFRKLLIGVVTHGTEATGVAPAWVGQMANTLQGENYDATIAFDWASASAQAVSGIVPQQAARLTNQIVATEAGLPVGPNDVVDVHLIGFSRGASVVALASAGLANAGIPVPLASGYVKLTLLDPHPSRNDGFRNESASEGPMGRLALKSYRNFQAATNDPALTVPANADYAEVLYQRTQYDQVFPPVSPEAYFNPWGSVPVGGNAAVTSYYDITPLTLSHSAVRQFYQETVVPNLGLGGDTLPFDPGGTPPTVQLTAALEAGNETGRGNLYELDRLRKGTTSIQTARHLLNDLSQINKQALGGKLTAAAGRLNRFITYVQANSGRKIQAPVAQGLIAAARLFQAELGARR